MKDSAGLEFAAMLIQTSVRIQYHQRFKEVHDARLPVLPAQPFVWLGAFARRARGRLAGNQAQKAKQVIYVSSAHAAYKLSPMGGERRGNVPMDEVAIEAQRGVSA
jgi:hypothetical protein